VIGKTLSHYRITEQLGKGGMGEVYLAEDSTLDRRVALKFLPEAFTSDPERMARFEREAKLLASLNHPNIAGIYGLEEADGKRFLVLEYVEGETLQARLRKGALPLEDALVLCRQIAEGLEAAHEKGVIHRDLKPGNVMITAEEKVKILDFGLAKALADETQTVDPADSPTITAEMTRPGVVLGTATYMSPEQAKGKSVDKRADIWAFGCILYECLTGKRVFEGETVTETLAAILRGEPDWDALPVITPQNIRFVLRRCLEKDKSRRFRDAADVWIGIEETNETREVITYGKSSWLWKGVAVVFVLAFAVLSFFSFREKPLSPKDLVRFNISLPDDISLSPTGGFAVSPDGKYLAFPAADSDGVQRFWLHRFDSLEAKPLVSTEFEGLNSGCFWSYDSRFIAYPVGKKLYKFDILGGSPQLICDTPRYPVGGSWNHDGVIIFGTDSGGLMRVSATGGPPRPLAVRTQNQGSHSFPKFLPDGRHFLYCLDSGNPERQGIYIGSLDSSPEEQDSVFLLPTTYSYWYVNDRNSGLGFLLFFHNRNLMAQQFDAKSLILLGKQIHLIGQVGSYSGQGFFSASNTGTLVYRRGGGSEYFQPTLFDRQGSVISKVGEAGIYYRLVISPNGNRAAVSWMNPASTFGSTDVCLLDLSGGPTQRLTHGKGIDNSRPIWSPDGKQIIFTSYLEGVNDLYLTKVNEVGDPELLLKSDESKYPTDWSSDGRFAMYTSYNPQTKRDLWVLPIDDAAKAFKLLATEFNEGDSHFSNDMKWIAYQSDESGKPEIYVRKLTESSGKLALTTRPIPISKDGGMGPRWSRDGRELFYRTEDDSVMAVRITADAEFESDVPRVLFQAKTDPITMNGLAPFPTWDVSSDGSRFLLAAPNVEASPSPLTVILNWTELLEK
jgi:serine/threonine protein kinase